MAGQPCSCGAVGSGDEVGNHSRPAGENRSSTTPSRYRGGVTPWLRRCVAPGATDLRSDVSEGAVGAAGGQALGLGVAEGGDDVVDALGGRVHGDRGLAALA